MSDNVLLAVLGSIGVGALLMSMDQKKSVKENWVGCALKNKVEAVVADKYGETNSLNFADDIYIKGNSRGKQMQQRQPKVEHFENRNVGLGGAAVTGDKFPFVTQPNYQQSTPLRSASIGLPASIRYNAPSNDKMGMTDSYQCKRTPLTENYEAAMGKSVQFHAPGTDVYPGPNYVAGGKVANPPLRSDFQVPENDMLPIGTIDNPLGDGKDVMVYDRPMTTTLKAGRFAGNGTRDLIRGDLPVMPDPSQKGWFQTPADPASLSTGALQAIAGVNEASTTLGNFVKMYGETSNIVGGVNNGYPVDNQYTSYDMLSMNNGMNGNTVNVTSF